MWMLALVGLAVTAMAGLFVLAATVQRLLSFRAEVVRMRLMEGAEPATPVAVAGDRRGIVDLREADMLLSSAENTFRFAHRRVLWSLVGLGGDPAQREADLVAACRELLEANQAVQQAALKLPGFEADGVADVPLFHDPVRELAGQGRWFAFAFFSLAPRFVRGAYSFRRVRAQLLPLLDATRDLQDQVGRYRKTHEPAPPRRPSLRHRVDTARPLGIHRLAA